MADPYPYNPFVQLLEGEGSQPYLEERDLEEEEEEEEETEEEYEGDEEDGEGENEGETVEFAGASSNWVEEERDKRRRIEAGEATTSDGLGSLVGSQGSCGSRSEIDGLFCPICMEAWTNNGEHHICCLPCGHIYGMSCIKRWLQQQRSSGKCPQCKRTCSMKDVRKLFVARIAVADEESEKRVRSLEAKYASLRKEVAEREGEWKKKETELLEQVCMLKERTTYLERLLENTQSKQSGITDTAGSFRGQPISGHRFSLESCRRGSSRGLVFEKELLVKGARLFDIDASSQVFLVARRHSGLGGAHLLTKISLISPHEREDIVLPSWMSAVRHLCIGPSTGRLALLASLGKKLAIFSTESNHIVLAYDLPDVAWSCSWDVNSSHYVYAGLKNGSLLVLDQRQTRGPLKTVRGLTNNPVHTIHSLSQTSTLSSGSRAVLSASALGLCLWNFDTSEEGPILVPETQNGVCISLAYCPNSNDVVATYRPRAGISNEVTFSQPSVTPSQPTGQRQGVEGSHVFFKGVGKSYLQKLCSSPAYVDGIRLPKTTIFDIKDHERWFASGDEMMGELVVQELPSWAHLQRFKVQKPPVRDVKFTHAQDQGILSCISEDTLQIFSVKL